MEMDDALRQVAIDLVMDAIRCVEKRPLKDHRTLEWIRKWAIQREKDRAWFQDPRRCAMWIEAAGLDYDALVERISSLGVPSDEVLAKQGIFPKPEGGYYRVQAREADDRDHHSVGDSGARSDAAESVEVSVG